MAVKKTTTSKTKKKPEAKKKTTKKDNNILRGRPTSMTEATLDKLKLAFMYGLKDVEACNYAGIHDATLYKYQRENPDFIKAKEVLKSNVKMHAKMNIADKIIQTGDIGQSWRYLEAMGEMNTEPEAPGIVINNTATSSASNVNKQWLAEMKKKMGK